MNPISIYKILPLALIGGMFLTNISSVNADYLVPQPSAINQLSITKQVKNPQTGQYVDNLTVTDVHFLPGQEVDFKVQITNTGNTQLNDVIFKDIFPASLNFVSGPGSFDSNSQTLSSDLGNLSPNQSTVINLTTRLKDSNSLPTNAVTCDPNLAQASSGGLISQATSTFCYENKVLAPVKQLPQTGPGETTFILASSVFFLGLSSYLFKKQSLLKGGE